MGGHQWVLNKERGIICSLRVCSAPSPPPMTQCTHSPSHCLSPLEHCPWPYSSPFAQELYSLNPGQTLAHVWLAWGWGDCKMPALCLKMRQLWYNSCPRAPMGSGWHPVQLSPHSSMPQPELDIGFFQEHPFPQQIVGAEIPASGSASRELVLSSIMTFLLHNLCHTSNFTLPSVLLCLIFAFPPDCELLCSLFFFLF